LIPENYLVTQVLDPFPEDLGVLGTGQAKSGLDVFQVLACEGVNIFLFLLMLLDGFIIQRAIIPESVEIANMEETVFGSVVVISLLNR
jgi:hypothetical protein